MRPSTCQCMCHPHTQWASDFAGQAAQVAAHPLCTCSCCGSVAAKSAADLRERWEAEYEQRRLARLCEETGLSRDNCSHCGESRPGEIVVAPGWRLHVGPSNEHFSSGEVGVKMRLERIKEDT